MKIFSLLHHKVKDIFQILSLSDDEKKLERFIDNIIYFKQKYIQEYGLLYNGVIEVLDILKNSSYISCICSNTSKDYIRNLALPNIHLYF